MRETQLSTCEKQFVSTTILEGLRLNDNRNDGFRTVNIIFGNERGCCETSLGETKVLCQVSCDIVQPKTAHPNEGLVFFNVELSPMSAPHFEIGRQADITTRITRMLEKNFKDSNCVDLESLCIIAEEKVWNIRVDLHILNYSGSVLDCCSIAALTSLLYFGHPDITMEGDKMTIHPAYEKDLIPLSVHHTPIICSFAVFPNSKCVPDPCALEERVMEGEIVIGMNTYQEICCLHVAGSTVTQQQVMSCAVVCHQRAQEVVKIIKERLKDVMNRKRDGGKQSFATALCGLKSTHRGEKIISLVTEDVEETIIELPTSTDISKEGGIVIATPISHSKMLEYSSSSSDSEIEVQMIQHIKADEKIQQIDLSDDDDEVVMLPAHHIMCGDKLENVIKTNRKNDPKAKGRNWYPDKDW